MLKLEKFGPSREFAVKIVDLVQQRRWAELSFHDVGLGQKRVASILKFINKFQI